MLIHTHTQSHSHTTVAVTPEQREDSFPLEGKIRVPREPWCHGGVGRYAPHSDLAGRAGRQETLSAGGSPPAGPGLDTEKWAGVKELRAGESVCAHVQTCARMYRYKGW